MKLTLREWRKAREMSQQKMADACGIHVNTYIKWEENAEKIPIGQAHTISMILNVPLDDISFVGKSTKCSEERLSFGAKDES